MTPTFIMLVGLPASGKSTYAKELAETHNANIHSSDSIREELSGDINNQNINDLVFKTLHSRVKEDLTNGKSCIYDATNINYKRRMAFLNELNKIPCEKICVFMATPYEVCLKNNRFYRDRKVPEEVIERMYRHFDVPYWYEGWDDIEVIYIDETHKEYYGTPYGFLNHYKFDDQHNSHHQLTLGKHCEKAWYYISQKQSGWDAHKVELRVATMLHDCGKPFCKTFKNNKGEITKEAHYYDHQYTGSYNSFFWGTDDIGSLTVATLIRWHMQPYFIKEEKTLNKYRKLWGEDLYKDIMLLHEAYDICLMFFLL